MKTIESKLKTEEQVLKPWKQWKLPVWANIRLLIIVAVVVIAAGSYFAFGKFISSGDVRKERWQAVFLDNGQVYFGKLSIDDDFYVLRSIYYLQAEETTIPGVTGVAGPADNQLQVPKKQNTRLIKFGNELHGPEDEMFIERTKVLFWENMKDDSNVVKAIGESK